MPEPAAWLFVLIALGVYFAGAAVYSWRRGNRLYSAGACAFAAMGLFMALKFGQAIY